MTEITIPVSISGNESKEIRFAVPFFDEDGKFLGMGYCVETVSSQTTSVVLPLSGDLSGATEMKVILCDENFFPITAAHGFDIPAE